MTNEYENTDDDKVIEVTPGMSLKTKLIIVAAIIIVAVVIIFSVRKAMNSRVYDSYEVVSSIETTGDNIASYVMFNDSVLKITKDGTSYIDNSGNTIWDCSYAMKMPEAVVRGDYAVVADLNGRDIYVFNKSGKVSSQTMNYDIANVDIAEQGVYVVVLAGDDCNYINAYDKDGNSVYERKTSIENSGYPLDITVSDDGEKLFTSYIKIDGTTVPDYLAAYNYGSVGQNENADRLVGGFTFEDTVFPLVRFVDNDTVACFGDNKIVIYAMDEKPSEKAVIDVENTEMLGVFSNSNYVGYIAASESGEDRYTIYIYDLNGKLEAETGYNNSFSDIYATENELMIVGEFDCSIYYLNGNKKFSTTFKKNLINIVPNGNKLEYIAIFENETQVIKLNKNDDGDK
jgi:hypothetical protein